MIIVLCAASKRPYIFPDALDICPAETCPTDDCRSATGKGTCIVGQVDGALSCLASFPSANVVMGCDCTAPPCEHMVEDHPALVPLIERFADLVEPPAERQARAREEARQRINARIPERGEGRRSALQPPLTPWQRVLQYAPEAAEWLPLRTTPKE